MLCLVFDFIAVFYCIFVFLTLARDMSDALKKKMSRRQDLKTSYSNAVGNAKKVLETCNPLTSKLLGVKSKLINVSEQLSKMNEEIFELLEADDIESDVLESETVTCELV